MVRTHDFVTVALALALTLLALALAACAGTKAGTVMSGAGGSGSGGVASGGGGHGTGGSSTASGGSGGGATGAGGAPATDGGGHPDASATDGGGEAGASVLPIFVDSLATGLSLAPFGGATNAISVDTNDLHSGTASLRVEVPASGYTGAAIVSGASVDLSRYDSVTFWAKASAAKSLNVVGLGNDGNLTTYSAEWNAVALTTTWTRYVLPIPLPSKVSAATGLLHFAEGSDEGAYTIWFDDIQYESVGPAILGPAQPAIAGETLSKQAGDKFLVDGASVTFSVNGRNQTIATARAYFTFATSAAAVATVDAAGTISAVVVGQALISATLGGTPATGGITVNVSAATAPVAAAPPPAASAATVISLLSSVYTSRTVDTWSASYDLADVSDVTIGGVATKKYTNLTFAGIEFFAAPTGPVDATALAVFHIDVWTATASQLQVKLVDFGADGAYAGGDDSESAMTFDATSTPALTTSAWVSLDIPFASFTGLAARAHLAQLLLTTNVGSTLFVENVYIHP